MTRCEVGKAIVSRHVDRQRRVEGRSPGGQILMVGYLRGLSYDDASRARSCQYFDNPAIFRSGLVVGRIGSIDAHDDRVLEGLVRQVTRKLVVQDAVCRNEPLRKRAVDEQQQHADETQRDCTVTFLFLLRFQRGQYPFRGRKYRKTQRFVMR